MRGVTLVKKDGRTGVWIAKVDGLAAVNILRDTEITGMTVAF